MSAKVWQKNKSMYLAELKVHEPWIAEISPAQYAGLSKAGKRRYDAKRHAEWDASSAAKQEFGRLVIAAFDAGEFKLDDETATKDAVDAVRYELLRRKKAVDAEAAKAARAALELGADDLVEGLKCKHLVYGEGRIVKVNRKTVKFDTGSGTVTVNKAFGTGRPLFSRISEAV